VSATLATVLALVGALGGSAIGAAASLLTTHSNRRMEQERRASEQAWSHQSELRTARRQAYSRFLSEQNAIIMEAAAVRDAVAREGRPVSVMPDSTRPIYERLENAWAEALMLAGPDVQAALVETHDALNQMVWASWEGRTDDPAGIGPLLEAMQAETIERPTSARLS